VKYHNIKKKEKKSQYKGVYWHKGSKKWYVTLHRKGQKAKYGGMFKDELDAAKRMNQLCEELEIAPQNHEISAIPNQKYQAKEKTSKYKGVSYHRETGKWDVRVSVKGEKQKYGGRLDDELDAAKRVNEICKDFGIPLKNPEISAIPNQKYQVQKKKRKDFTI